jgi:transcriptional regulator of acetoin/glycerol metabolism
MLETREVLRLGSTTHEKVDIHLCAATWRDLRQEVAAGRFREDLYFRLGQPEVKLPPLRERPEEIPWHVQQVLDECRGDRNLMATSAFIEACALRMWPGNVREIRAEVRRATAAAVALDSNVLTADDLSKTAGHPITPSKPPTPEPPSPNFPQDEFAAALAAEKGNVVRAAQRLGVDRNQLRRWLERYKVDPKRFKSSDSDGS